MSWEPSSIFHCTRQSPNCCSLLFSASGMIQTLIHFMFRQLILLLTDRILLEVRRHACLVVWTLYIMPLVLCEKVFYPEGTLHCASHIIYLCAGWFFNEPIFPVLSYRFHVVSGTCEANTGVLFLKTLHTHSVMAVLGSASPSVFSTCQKQILEIVQRPILLLFDYCTTLSHRSCELSFKNAQSSWYISSLHGAGVGTGVGAGLGVPTPSSTPSPTQVCNVAR